MRLSEGVQISWRMTVLNVFNHPNYFSVDSVLEDALAPAAQAELIGFATPEVTTGADPNTPSRGMRRIFFGLKIQF